METATATSDSEKAFDGMGVLGRDKSSIVVCVCATGCLSLIRAARSAVEVGIPEKVRDTVALLNPQSHARAAGRRELEASWFCLSASGLSRHVIC